MPGAAGIVLCFQGFAVTASSRLPAAVVHAVSQA